MFEKMRARKELTDGDKFKIDKIKRCIFDFEYESNIYMNDCRKRNELHKTLDELTTEAAQASRNVRDLMFIDEDSLNIRKIAANRINNINIEITELYNDILKIYSIIDKDIERMNFEKKCLVEYKNNLRYVKISESEVVWFYKFVRLFDEWDRKKNPGMFTLSVAEYLGVDNVNIEMMRRYL